MGAQNAHIPGNKVRQGNSTSQPSTLSAVFCSWRPDVKVLGAKFWLAFISVLLTGIMYLKLSL